MKTVVFVDDESSVLDGLRRSLRRKRDQWATRYFSSAEEALAYIRVDKVDVVVSDMRMPGMNGAEFLRAVQEVQPNAVRLALSGYADSQLILESAHAIHQHISKPAKISTITDAVERSLALQNTLSNPQLQRYVGSLEALPSMPHVYDEIMQLFSRDTFSEQEIVDVIEKDVGFTATVLRIVNSDFFGNFGNIGSISEAVSKLGTETMKNIVLSENLFKQFEHANLDELEQLNVLSKSVSALAHKFGRTVDLQGRAKDHCQLGGMVCTMGDMVMLDAGAPAGDISSPIISAHLLNLWSMPDSLVEAVLHHRDPVDPNYRLREAEVTAADCLRAAWFSCSEYLFVEESARQGSEHELRVILQAIAKNEDLAEKWYDYLAATII